MPSVSIRDRENVVPVPSISLQDRDDAIPVPSVSLQDRDDAIPVPSVSLPDRDDAIPMPEVSLPDRDDAIPMPEVSMQDRDDAIPVPEVSLPDRDHAIPVPEVSLPDRDLTLRGGLDRRKSASYRAGLHTKGNAMANIEGPKYTGVLKVDLSPMADDLRDIAPGGLKGARAEKEGLKDVLIELAHAVPAYGDAAEIHPATYQRVVQATKVIETLTNDEIVLMKLLEVCRESRTRLVNNREEDISAIAKKSEDKGEKGKQPELLAHFQKTIAYRSVSADKAAETRQKNEAAKAEAEVEAQAKNTPGVGASAPTDTAPTGTGAPTGTTESKS